MSGEHQLPSQSTLTEQVREAFAAVRHGDLGPVSALQDAGPALAPLLKPYLADASEAVRREALSLLTVVRGPDALPLLAAALTDDSPEIRERVSRALYEGYSPTQIQGLGKALAASVRQGQLSAPALLLLAYCPGESSILALRTAIKDSSPVKLLEWSTPVPVSLPAYVALARLGEPDARQALLAVVHRGETSDLEFLLSAMREIEAREVLSALTATLTDTRNSAETLPVSHSVRRLCDVAVDAFVRRLGLATSFEISEAATYDAEQIHEVRRQTTAVLTK